MISAFEVVSFAHLAILPQIINHYWLHYEY